MASRPAPAARKPSGRTWPNARRDRRRDAPCHAAPLSNFRKMKDRPMSIGASHFSRRDFLKLSAMLTAAGALPLLNAGAARARDPDEAARIGYLPITEATPLLVAPGTGQFVEGGLQGDKTIRFHG